MKKLTIGAFAHVDSGKTTLIEAMLYETGTIRKLGRVDHKDSFLDTDSQERARGITIFSKICVLSFGESQVTLLDTPGHTDFSQEAERAMGVLDYAILLVDGKEGPMPHTKTLLDLLDKNQIPVFCFINKMDMAGADREKTLAELSRLSKGRCVDAQNLEEVAMASEEMMETFLEEGLVRDEDMAKSIKDRKLIPCFFGSALKLEGVKEFIDRIDKLTLAYDKTQGADFAARVFKIGKDPQGGRLTFVKITAGSLKVRDEIGNEKVNQIRHYSGDKYITLEKAEAGDVVALTGLDNTYIGQGLGRELTKFDTALEPLFNYSVKVLNEDPFTAFGKLREIEEEDPTLHLKWDENSGSISMDLMGPIQTEVLMTQAKERLGLELEFSQGEIKYKETISEAVEGVGHYEPLKHYAEVHLLLEPAEAGSGLTFESMVSEDVLDKNWQRLIMTHLLEKEHVGVLTKSPITDMKISIVAGRAHLKHTEGGDFRQSTYRAIRNGLMKAREMGATVLLEPYYEFEITLPTESMGRAMTDIKNMGGEARIADTAGETILTGQCPVKGMTTYQETLASYTKGAGRLSVKLAEYMPCRTQQKIVEEIAYEPERDLDNSADSIFCEHGAGFNVPWNQVEEYMHIPYVYKGRKDTTGMTARFDENLGASWGKEEDKELKRIFENTYGKINEVPNVEKRQIVSKKVKEAEVDLRLKDEYLIVDGYNIIFAWPELKELSKVNLDAARDALIEILSNYQGYRRCRLMIAFDSYKVKNAVERVERRGAVEVAFTKEGETADTFIEKLTYGMKKDYSVRVATSDALEQNSVLVHGATRVSARELIEEIKQIELEIQEIIERNNRGNSRNRISEEAFEKN